MKIWADPFRRRWILWGLLASVFLLVNIYRLSTAVIFEELMVAFQTTGAQLGTLHAIFFYVYAILQIPAGIMADRFGPRLTAGFGALIMNVGAVLFGLSSTFQFALFSRFLIGLGASVIFISILRFCANWFRTDEFATMNGLSFAISGIGGILATTPLALIAASVGWRTAIGGLGIIGIFISVAVLGAVRSSPVEAGFSTIEGIPDQAKMSIGDIRVHVVDVFKDRWTWVISLFLFCTSGVNLTIFGLWGVPYVVQMYGVSVAYASIFTLLGSVGLLTGPPIVGIVSDRIGKRTEILVAGSSVYILTLGTLAVFSDVPLLVVASVYFIAGWLLGVFVLTYPIIKERHPISASGLSMGTINGAAFLGASVLPTIMGIALDSYWTGEIVGGVRVYSTTGYQIAFGIATTCGIIALSCALWLHYRKNS